MTANRLRILFVDDEEKALHGIRRLLHHQCETWEMEFATDGISALAMMAERPVDVVISDMKMPIMDGAEFLSQVRTRHPSTVRIILSGFCEREAVMRTIGPSHRYLAKPCSQKELVDAVEQALALRNYIDGNPLKTVVSNLSHLPTLPATYATIVRELGSDSASAETVAEVVGGDIAISAQLMKLTNSAYFNRPMKATTVRQAIQALGFDNVRAVVLLAGIFEVSAGTDSDGKRTAISRRAVVGRTGGIWTRFACAPVGRSDRARVEVRRSVGCGTGNNARPDRLCGHSTRSCGEAGT